MRDETSLFFATYLQETKLCQKKKREVSMSFLPSSPTLAARQPGDDVDTLFYQLLQIEPSGELVARILSHVRRLPGPLWQEDQLEAPQDAGVDALIARNEKPDPS
jgi:hypothetical protein